MLIPRRTKVERAGLVLSVASLLAVSIGVIAVAPDRRVAVLHQVPNSETQRRKCIKEETARQEKTPEGVGVIGSYDRFGNVPPEVLCNMDGVSVDGWRSLSMVEYMRSYTDAVASAVDSRNNDFMKGLLLYWGTRLLTVGLVLMYLFEITIGRILRFIWRGSARA